MSDANPDRGEVAISLRGKEYVLRPSYEAQVAIERQLKTSLDELFVRARRFVGALQNDDAPATGSGLMLEEMAVIFCEGVKAANKDRKDSITVGWTPERASELIAEDRFGAMQPIAAFVFNAVFGGEQKKEQAASEHAA